MKANRKILVFVVFTLVSKIYFEYAKETQSTFARKEEEEREIRVARQADENVKNVVEVGHTPGIVANLLSAVGIPNAQTAVPAPLTVPTQAAILNINFVINPENFCTSSPEEVFILAYVFTQIRNLDLRNMIRQTWANREAFPMLKVVFVLGLSQNASLNEAARQESLVYNDLIQNNVIDSYRNLGNG